MRFLAFVSVLFLTSCASTPAPEPAALAQVIPALGQTGLIGAGESELIGRFGAAQFQVREGPGLKLQWGGAACVLDVYLYRPADGSAPERVVLADARRLDGSTIDAGVCAGQLSVGRL
jgi:hypothetical protein